MHVGWRTLAPHSRFVEFGERLKRAPGNARRSGPGSPAKSMREFNCSHPLLQAVVVVVPNPAMPQQIGPMIYLSGAILSCSLLCPTEPAHQTDIFALDQTRHYRLEPCETVPGRHCG